MAVAITDGVFSTMDGIFNIDKERGVTSHDVVQRVRRLARQKHVGHAGTLDPAAEGVLLVCLGKATKVVEYLMDSPKRYCAQVTLGAVTDTGDADGKIIWRAEAVTVDRTQVEEALQAFRGRIKQVPPAYSALKRGGTPLYRLARRGLDFPREAREVEIYDLRLMAWEPPVAVIDVTCSRGTYVRALATDLGERLGCGAYLSRLVRLASGRFTLEDAVRMEALASAFAAGRASDYLYAPDEALLGTFAVVLGPESDRLVRHGSSIAIELASEAAPRHGDLCRAYGLQGDLLAVLRYDSASHLWQPDKVFVV